MGVHRERSMEAVGFVELLAAPAAKRRWLADLKRSTKLFMDETRAPVLDPGRERPKPDTSERLPAMIDPGAARLHRVLHSPMPPVGAGSMPNGYCRASAASCRSTAMPDTTA